MKCIPTLIMTLFVFLILNSRANAQGMPPELRPKFKMQYCDVADIRTNSATETKCFDWEFFADELEFVVEDSVFGPLPKRVEEIGAVRTAIGSGALEEYEFYSERFSRKFNLNLEELGRMRDAGFGNIVRVRFKNTKTLEDLGKWAIVFSQDYNVRRIYFSSVVKADGHTNDPVASEQWYLEKYKFEEAQIDEEAKFGSSEIHTTFFDTGYDLTHKDLPKPVGGFNHVAGIEEIPEDGYGHGTAVAGVLAQIPNNEVGGLGTSPGVSIWIRKVLTDEGTGEWGVLAEAIVAQTNKCMELRKQNPDVRCTFNFSLTGLGPIPSVDAALDMAYKEGIVGVAGAGNFPVSLDRIPLYPAASPGTIAVAGLDRFDKLATFSAFGLKVPTVAAGGIFIVTTTPTKNSKFSSPTGYRIWHGTSFAAPQVVGAINLAWTKHRSLTRKKIAFSVLGSNDTIKNLQTFVTSGGKLNALLMLDVPIESPPPLQRFTITDVSHISVKTGHVSVNDANGGKIIGFVHYLSTEPFDESTLDRKDILAINTILLRGSGEGVEKMIGNLREITTYYIAAQAFDRGGNSSSLSPVLEFTTRKSQIHTERTFSDESGGPDPGQWFSEHGPSARFFEDATGSKPANPWHLSDIMPSSSGETRFNWRFGRPGGLDYLVGFSDAVVKSEILDLRSVNGASLSFDYFQNISPIILGDNFQVYVVPLENESNKELDSILLKEFLWVDGSTSFRMTEQTLDLSVVSRQKFRLIFRVISRTGGFLGGSGWMFGNIKIFIDEDQFFY